MNKIDVRGVLFDNVTKEEALSEICRRLESGIPTAVFTPNSEIVQSCVEDSSFAELINSANILLPDGIGVVKAASILGTPLKEKVAGIEVGEALFSLLDKEKHSFFLLGGKPEGDGVPSVAECAARKMTEKYHCRIVGHHDGYFNTESDENESIIRMIDLSGADVLYVCLGSPKQEKWICANREKLNNVKLLIGLGGSLDIYSGMSKRAPSLFIRCGTEWLWRLLSEPSRIGRMMKLPKFYFGTWKYKLKNR